VPEIAVKEKPIGLKNPGVLNTYGVVPKVLISAAVIVPDIFIKLEGFKI
jgi:hypothetical protein